MPFSHKLVRELTIEMWCQDVYFMHTCLMYTLLKEVFLNYALLECLRANITAKGISYIQVMCTSPYLRVG